MLNKSGVFSSIFVLFLLAACGESPQSTTTQALPSLEGQWQLVSVSCDGTGSTIISEAALLDGTALSSKVSFQGDSGKRIWDFGACQAVVPLSSVSYPGNNIIRMTEQPTECNTACGSAPGCVTPTYADIDYPYQVQNDLLTVDIPESVIARIPPPCATPSQKVSFIYKKVTQ